MMNTVIICLLILASTAWSQESNRENDYIVLANKPADVRIDGRLVVRYYATLLDSPPAQRAEATEQRIDYALGHMSSGNIAVSKSDAGYAIMLDHNPTVFITHLDKDPLSAESIDKVVNRSQEMIGTIAAEYREARSLPDIIRGIAIAVIATALFYVLLRLLLYVRKNVVSGVISFVENLIQQTRLSKMVVGSRLIPVVLKRIIAVFTAALISVVSFFYVTVVFGQFPITRTYGNGMLQMVSDSVVFVLKSIVQSILGLLLVTVIFLLALYINRGMRTLLDRMESGAIKFASLNNELFAPTRRITSVIIWIFAFAIAYPYIPGSSTDAFKGVSIVVGLMLALGASGAIGQAVSGVILMYSRKLKSGEWVTIGEHTGRVENIGFAVTRLVTPYNEEILIPNATIMTTTVISHSRLGGSGTVYTTSISIGYDTPWRLIHKMLLAAAKKSEYIIQEPEPFVTQAMLGDFYVEYKLTVHISDDTKRRVAIDALHSMIQDIFNENDVQIMSPHYFNDPEQPKIIEKKMWDPPLSSDKPVAKPSMRAHRLERTLHVKRDGDTEEIGVENKTLIR